jgi:hypothetical protein
MRLHLFIELLISPPYTKMRTRGEKYFYGCLHNDDQQVNAQWNFFSRSQQSCFVLSKHFLVFILLGKKLTEEKIFFSGSPRLFPLCLLNICHSFAGSRKKFIKISNKKVGQVNKTCPVPKNFLTSENTKRHLTGNATLDA